MNSYIKVLEKQDFSLDNESSLLRINPCDSGIYPVWKVRSLFNIDLRPIYKEDDRVIVSAGKSGTYISELNGEIILNY